MNQILETTAYVVEHSKNVIINEDKLKEFSKTIMEDKAEEKAKKEETELWVKVAPFDMTRLSIQDQLTFTFFLCSQAFCYWGDPKWKIEYKGKFYGGTFGFIAAMGKAIENGIPLLDLEFLKNITEEEFAKIVHGTAKIPLLKERIAITREFGRVMCERYNKKYNELLKEKDLIKMQEILTKTFPLCFKDESEYNNKTVVYNKKVQLLIGMLHELGFSRYDNFNELTGCADYKLPKMLRLAEILEYSEKLARKVDNNILIEKDSIEENEIRSCTVFAIELLREQCNGLNAKDINDYIWLSSQKEEEKPTPYHLCRTTAY